jgi:hypothetical protein
MQHLHTTWVELEVASTGEVYQLPLAFFEYFELHEAA